MAVRDIVVAWRMACIALCAVTAIYAVATVTLMTLHAESVAAIYAALAPR